jgi:hypothetical protein
MPTKAVGRTPGFKVVDPDDPAHAARTVVSAEVTVSRERSMGDRFGV